MTHLVIFSGGLDSTTLLAHVIKKHGVQNVRAISFDYDQRHRRELSAAATIATHLAVRHTVIGVPNLFGPSALLGDSEIPHGEYSAENIPQTEVVGRNLLFASLAVAHATPGDSVWAGVHAGDETYPDCKPEFWDPLADATHAAYRISIHTPFMFLTKREIVGRSGDLKAPLHLTYSCYEGNPEHCGKCATCLERQQAFLQAGTVDPTAYQQPVAS